MALTGSGTGLLETGRTGAGELSGTGGKSDSETGPGMMSGSVDRSQNENADELVTDKGRYEMSSLEDDKPESTATSGATAAAVLDLVTGVVMSGYRDQR